MRSAALSLTALALCGAPDALAQSGPVEYALSAESTLVHAAAPSRTLADSLSGSFNLVFMGLDPATRAERYVIAAIDWTSGSGTALSGSGTYEVHGTAPAAHRLRLDLVVDGAAPWQVDSGLVSGGGRFPALAADAGAAGGSVLLRAAPTSVGASFCPPSVNSTGARAVLLAQGSATVGENDLRLVARDCPPSTLGVFVLGSERAQAPLGGSPLCLSGSLIHGAVRLTCPAGGAFERLDLTQGAAAGQIVSGTTWGFQFLYRDPASSAPGANSTNAVEVAFE